MTKYNYFCWSEEYNSDTSFQQKRYRIFNTEVSEAEYNKVKKIYHKLEFDSNDNYDVRFSNAFRKMWDKLTREEKQEYLDIPHFNWEGFTYITGITPADVDDEVIEFTLEDIAKLKGVDVRRIKIKK